MYERRQHTRIHKFDLSVKTTCSRPFGLSSPSPPAINIKAQSSTYNQKPAPNFTPIGRNHRRVLQEFECFRFGHHCIMFRGTFAIVVLHLYLVRDDWNLVEKEIQFRR